VARALRPVRGVLDKICYYRNAQNKSLPETIPQGAQQFVSQLPASGFLLPG
jgi:hypothetical protein